MYITEKLSNWINHCTVGQRAVLTEARDELESTRFALDHLHEQVAAYYPGFYDHPAMKMARETLARGEESE